MRALASQITSLTIVHSTVYSGADHRKHQSSASLAFVRGIHRWPVNSPHKGPVTRKIFPFGDVIMYHRRHLPHQIRVPVLKIRRSRDRLIFNMVIPILVRRHIWIETALRATSINKNSTVCLAACSDNNNGNSKVTHYWSSGGEIYRFPLTKSLYCGKRFYAMMSSGTKMASILQTIIWKVLFSESTVQWRHNGRDGVSNHQPHDCLLNRLFSRRSKKTSKLRVTGHCTGNSPVTGELLAKKTTNEENVSILLRHHGICTFGWVFRNGFLR